MGHYFESAVWAFVLAFAIVYALSIVISAFRQGWKGILLIVGVACVIFGSHYGTSDVMGVVSALGCLAIGSSVTIAFMQATRT